MKYEEYFGQNYGIGTAATNVTPEEDWSNYFKEQIKPGGMPIQKMYSDSPVMVEGVQASRYMDVGAVEVIRPTHEQMINNYAQRAAEERMKEEQKRYYQSWQERVDDMVKHPEEEEPVEEPVVNNEQKPEEEVVQKEQSVNEEQKIEVVPADDLTEMPDEGNLFIDNTEQTEPEDTVEEGAEYIGDGQDEETVTEEGGDITTPTEEEIPSEEEERIDGIYIINNSEAVSVSVSDGPTDVTRAEVNDKFTEPSVVLPNIPEPVEDPLDEPILEPGGLDITDMEVNVDFDDENDGLYFEDEEEAETPPSDISSDEYVRDSEEPNEKSAEISGLLPDEEPHPTAKRGRPKKTEAAAKKPAAKVSAKKPAKKPVKKTTTKKNSKK